MSKKVNGAPKSRNLKEDDVNPVEFAKSLENPVQNKEEVTVMKEQESTPVVNEQENTNEVSSVPATPVKPLAQIIAERAQELIAEGKSMIEAIAQATEENKPKVTQVAGRTILDADGLVSRMHSETNIESLKHRIKIAYAKKSKSQGKDSEAKYDQEIKAGQARLNELINMAEAEATPLLKIKKYQELGESTGAILQMILREMELRLEDQLKTIREKSKVNTKDQKAQVNQAPDTTPDSVKEELTQFGADYLALFEDRLGRNDVRCQIINKRTNYLTALTNIKKEEVGA